jgi:hypothetical protein
MDGLDENRLDIMLNRDGDVIFSENGDIAPTDGIRQAVVIRLRWFLNEWRFAPPFGMPYFEEILVKNPDLERIKVIIRDECMSVDGVKDITNISVDYDPRARAAVFRLNIVTGEKIYNEEVNIRV